MRTPKPVKFPKDSGVTMEGFESIRIPSRERVGHQLQVFIDSAPKSRSVTVRTVLGTWGEGKTETYERFLFSYCKKKGFACFFVSASTIANAYSHSKISSLVESSPVPAIRFTAALLSSIRSEKTKSGSVDPETVIQNPDTFLEADEFIKKSFEKIKSFQRLFVFIDEFEELLLREELKPIISGIKELINGQLPDVDEDGEFEGLLHLIICCTPEAFYYLQTSGEFEQIFGSFARRQDVIQLSQISKSEGMNFLWSLLQYCYDFNLPSTISISSSGIFEALLRIGQRNLGVLVSLFSRMMQENFSRDSEDSIIDGEFLIEFLRDKPVFVYGMDAKCVDEEIYQSISDTITKHAPEESRELCWKIMRIIMGEPRPFSYEEISNRIGISPERAKRIIEILIKITERYSKIKNAIVEVKKLRNETETSEVIDKLNRFIIRENGKEIIQMDQYEQNLVQFIDQLTFYELKSTGLRPRIFFPNEKTDVDIFFPGIRSETSEEVLRRTKNFKEDETLFVISEDLLSAIYPSPVPLGLEYIIDRRERIKIWNEVAKHLNEYYEQYIREAIFSLMNITNKITLQAVGRYEKSVAEISAVGIGEVRICVWACTADVTENDIICISDFIRESEIPIHLVLLFYTGSVTDSAKEEMENLGLIEENFSRILDIRLHPMLSRRILSHYLSRNKKLSYFMTSQKLAIDGEKYNEVAESLFDELKLLHRIAEWEISQRESGFIIDDLTTESGSSEKVAEALKHFLNFPDEKDFSEVFNKNQDTVRRFVRYGSKDVPIIDIESDNKLEKLGQDLIGNKMLEKRDGRFLTPLHPVEERILYILDQRTRMKIDELEKMFIQKSKNKKIFRDIFLNTLKMRGQIKTKGENVEITSLREIHEDLDKRVEKLKRMWTRDETIKFGIFYEEKKEKIHTFMASEFREFTEELLNFIDMNKYVSDPEIESKLYRKITLLIEMIDHFQEEIFPLFSNAFKKANSNRTKFYSMLTLLEGKLMKLVNLSHEWLGIIIEKEQIDDWKELKELKDQFELTIDQNIDSNTFNTFISKIDRKGNPFFFRNDEGAALFFNPKLHFVENLMEKFTKEASELQEMIDKINSILENTENQRNRLLLQLRTPETSEEHPLSYKIMKHLKSVSMKGNIQELKKERIQLERIKEIAENSKNEFDGFFRLHISSIDEFKKLIKIEIDIRKTLESKKNLFSIAEKKMDTLRLYNIFEKEKENFNQIQNNYLLLQEYTLPDAVSEIPGSLENLRNELEELIEHAKKSSERIESEWEMEVESIMKNSEHHLLILEALVPRGKDEGINRQILEIRQLRNNIIGKNLLESPFSMKTLEDKLKEFSKEFTDILGSELDRNYECVLLEIIKFCREKGQNFMSLREFNRISKEKGIDPNQMRDIINTLMRRNLIEGWVSLPQKKLEN